MIDLTQVLTFSEAADKWGLASGNTLRKAVERNKFFPEEIRKSGDVWLTTYDAMLRVYGTPPCSDFIISLDEFTSLLSDSAFLKEDIHDQIQSMFSSMQTTIDQKKTITILRSYDHPETIFSIIKTNEELQLTFKYLKRYLESMTL